MKIVPYDLYVKFLVTKGHHSLKEINDELSKVQLAPINQNIFERHIRAVKSVLPAPIWDQIEKQKIYGQAFFKWMKALDLDEIWLAEKAYRSEETVKLWTLIYDISEDPQVRMAVRAMLMKKSELEELANALNAKYATMLNKNHLRLFRKFMWNHALMKRKDWKDYLLQESVSNSEKDLLFSCLTETEDVVRTKLGLPANLITSDILQMMATESVLKVKHFLKVQDQNGNREARFWMDKAQQLLALREKYKAADLRDFSKELQMQFEYVETEFETPDEEVLKEVQEKDPTSKEGEEKKDDTASQESLDV